MDGGMQQPLDPSYLEGCASMLDQIDKRVMVVLRDSRNIIGMLRSCDQFNNLLLYDSIERIFLKGEYSEIPLGIFIVRGDNVLLVGEVDSDREANIQNVLKQIPYHVMLGKKRQQDEKDKLVAAKKCELAKLRGVTYQDPAEVDD